MKRIFLGLCAVLLGASSLLVFVPDANAASPYDDLLKTTNSISLIDYGDDEKVVDWSLNWYTEVLEALQLRALYTGGQWVQTLDVFANLDQDSNWMVMKNDQNNTISVVFTESGGYCNFINPDAYQTFQCFSDNTLYTRVELTNNGNCSTGNFRTENCNYLRSVTPNSSSRFFIEKNGSNSDYEIFFSYFPIEYPTGYEGVILPESAPLPDEPDRAQFDWTVAQNGDITVRYAKNLDYEIDGRMRLKISECNEDFSICDNDLFGELWEDNASTASWSNPFVKPPLAPIELKLPDAGSYFFEVVVIKSPGTDQNVVGSAWQVKWDGKTFVSGQTDPENVFAPWSYFQNPVWEAFSKITVPVYGVQALVQAPLSFVAGLTSQLGNCQPIQLPQIKFLNMTYECLSPPIKSNFGALVTAFQTISTAVILYWVSMQLFAFVKNSQDPRRNQIEVFKL